MDRVCACDDRETVIRSEIRTTHASGAARHLQPHSSQSTTCDLLPFPSQRSSDRKEGFQSWSSKRVERSTSMQHYRGSSRNSINVLVIRIPSFIVRQATSRALLFERLFNGLSELERLVQIEKTSHRDVAIPNRDPQCHCCWGSVSQEDLVVMDTGRHSGARNDSPEKLASKKTRVVPLWKHLPHQPGQICRDVRFNAYYTKCQDCRLSECAHMRFWRSRLSNLPGGPSSSRPSSLWIPLSAWI